MVVSADLRRTRIERIFRNLPRYEKVRSNVDYPKFESTTAVTKNNIQQQSSQWFKKAT
jgi:hypothetical protein